MNYLCGFLDSSILGGDMSLPFFLHVPTGNAIESEHLNDVGRREYSDLPSVVAIFFSDDMISFSSVSVLDAPSGFGLFLRSSLVVRSHMLASTNLSSANFTVNFSLAILSIVESYHFPSYITILQYLPA